MSVTYSTKNVKVDPDDGAAVFAVVRAGTKSDLDEATSVLYRTADLSARHGTDYTATSGVLAFAAGETRKSIDVLVLDTAFETSAIKTFLLELEQFGSATASLSPDVKLDHTQGYWLIPGDGNAVRIPTKESSGDYAKAQMDVSDFSDPPRGESSEKLPHSYFRLGHARPDMNFPERLIASSPGFFATTKDAAGTIELGPDGAPREPGATEKFMKPRNIDRELSNWQQKKVDNKHLDGIFFYTEGSMTTSTLGSATYVVNGAYVLNIGGETRFNYMGDVTTMFMSSHDGIWRYAQGTQTVGDEFVEYEVKGTRSLEMVMEDSARYTTSKEFVLNTAAQTEIFTGYKYEVTNDVTFEVTGLDVSAKFDVLGNYEIDFMAGECLETRTERQIATAGSIVLQIDPVTTLQRKASLASFAAGNMLLVASAEAASEEAFNSSDKDFDENFSDLGAGTGATARLMHASVPALFDGLEVLGAALAIGLVVEQKLASVKPNLFPKMTMTPVDMTFSVGPTQLVLTAAGVKLNAPVINMTSEGLCAIEADDFTIDSLEGTMAIAELGIASDASLVGDLNVEGVVNVSGNVTALNILAGV